MTPSLRTRPIVINWGVIDEWRACDRHVYWLRNGHYWRARYWTGVIVQYGYGKVVNMDGKRVLLRWNSFVCGMPDWAGSR